MRDLNAVVNELKRLDTGPDGKPSGRLEASEIRHMVSFVVPDMNWEIPNQLLLDERGFAKALAGRLKEQGFDPENDKDVSLIVGLIRMNMKGGVEDVRLSDMCGPGTGFSCRTSPDGAMVTFSRSQQT